MKLYYSHYYAFFLGGGGHRKFIRSCEFDRQLTNKIIFCHFHCCHRIITLNKFQIFLTINKCVNKYKQKSLFKNLF